VLRLALPPPDDHVLNKSEAGLGSRHRNETIEDLVEPYLATLCVFGGRIGMEISISGQFAAQDHA
jgi:hypothetical protein